MSTQCRELRSFNSRCGNNNFARLNGVQRTFWFFPFVRLLQLWYLKHSFFQAIESNAVHRVLFQARRWIISCEYFLLTFSYFWADREDWVIPWKCWMNAKFHPMAILALTEYTLNCDDIGLTPLPEIHRRAKSQCIEFRDFCCTKSEIRCRHDKEEKPVCERSREKTETQMQRPSSNLRANWMEFSYYGNLSRPFPINT